MQVNSNAPLILGNSSENMIHRHPSSGNLNSLTTSGGWAGTTSTSYMANQVYSSNS